MHWPAARLFPCLSSFLLTIRFALQSSRSTISTPLTVLLCFWLRLVTKPISTTPLSVRQRHPDASKTIFLWLTSLCARSRLIHPEYTNADGTNGWCRNYVGGCTYRGRGAIQVRDATAKIRKNFSFSSIGSDSPLPPFQLTHRYNYEKAGKELGQPFVTNPGTLDPCDTGHLRSLSFPFFSLIRYGRYSALGFQGAFFVA